MHYLRKQRHQWRHKGPFIKYDRNRRGQEGLPISNGDFMLLTSFYIQRGGVKKALKFRPYFMYGPKMYTQFKTSLSIGF